MCASCRRGQRSFCQQAVLCVLLAEEEENAEEENGEGACALVDQEGDPVFERHCWHL